jgi:hypothetical protein
MQDFISKVQFSPEIRNFLDGGETSCIRQKIMFVLCKELKEPVKRNLPASNDPIERRRYYSTICKALRILFPQCPFSTTKDDPKRTVRAFSVFISSKKFFYFSPFLDCLSFSVSVGLNEATFSVSQTRKV